MKLSLKTKVEPTIQRKLRLPVSLNNRMNGTAKLADELGVDYHATLVAATEQFNDELDGRLREMKTKGQHATTFSSTIGLTKEATQGLTAEASSVPATKDLPPPGSNQTHASNGAGSKGTPADRHG
jgi:hypothetical protein